MFTDLRVIHIFKKLSIIKANLHLCLHDHFSVLRPIQSILVFRIPANLSGEKCYFINLYFFD